ncbi:hypothetical protein [Sigmofec virus UA08Rod_4343]|uniref:Uncharacterized protein n=1 Tax=Sigmofec virus UA08Rod_4343 TaxID=2929400 RepID=A0A976R5D1_9VIRU|nr:hypothetical protein [Sigmofec virus UA08Rod_4343]
MENETKKFIVSKVVNAILAFLASLAGIFFGG